MTEADLTPPTLIRPHNRALPLLTLTDLRIAESQAAASLPQHTLMDRAGKAAASFLLEQITRDTSVEKSRQRVWLIAGPGNNGGDALILAAELHKAGIAVELCMPVKQVVVPLDVTDTVKMDKALYDRIAHDPTKQTIITQLFKTLNGYGFDGKNGFETNPNYTTNIWDTLTLGYLMHPSFATQTVDEWVDVDTSFGANDGKATGYSSSPPAGLQKMTIVKRFDNQN